METLDKEFDTIEKDRLLAQALAEHDSDCSQDEALAKILQKQFDLEYDDEIDRQEERLNGSAKVGISLDKFKRYKRYSGAESRSESEDDEYREPGEQAWDVFEENDLKQKSRMLGRSGIVVDELGNMITKHDIPTSSRRNMRKLMEMKTDIDTGDAGTNKDDLRITNYVYNRLKVHSKKSHKRNSQKFLLKKDAHVDVTSHLSPEIQSLKLNEMTQCIVEELLTQGKITKLTHTIGEGKESIIIHGLAENEDGKTIEVAIKIFKSCKTVAFKTRDAYNKSKCPSYKFDKPYSKKDALNKWVEKSYKNLKVLLKGDINCPVPMLLAKNVLVMSFLGVDGKPAPQLRHAELNNEQLLMVYEKVKNIMIRMYELDFVHSDLSEYNLLWWNDDIHVIDVSQMVPKNHPNSNKFLLRDCLNIVKFFEKNGLEQVDDFKSLFSLVCGKDLSRKDLDFWNMIEDFPCNDKLMQKTNNSGEKCASNTGDTFENMLNYAAKDKKDNITKDSDKLPLSKKNIIIPVQESVPMAQSLAQKSNSTTKKHDASENFSINESLDTHAFSLRKS